MNIFNFESLAKKETLKEGYVKIQLPLGISLDMNNPNFCNMGGDVYTYGTFQTLCKYPNATGEYINFNGVISKDAEAATHGAYTYYIKEDLLPKVEQLKAEGNYFAMQFRVVAPNEGLSTTIIDNDEGILNNLNNAWNTVTSYFGTEE